MKKNVMNLMRKLKKKWKIMEKNPLSMNLLYNLQKNTLIFIILMRQARKKGGKSNEKISKSINFCFFW